MANGLLAETESEPEKALNAVDENLAMLEQQLRPLAQRKMALLKQKLRYLDEVLRQRTRVVGDLQALQELYADLEIEGSDKPVSKDIQSQQTRDYSNMKVWEAAREVLRKSGHPMYTREIAEGVVAGGRHVSEPISSKLNSNMRQKPSVFVSEEQNRKSIWHLREWEEQQHEMSSRLEG